MSRPRPSAVSLWLLVPLAAGGMAGCSTSADVFYGEYRAGPGYETSQGYEGRVYGDASQGFGGEACRSVSQRQVDRYGNMSAGETVMCDETMPPDLE